jgi:hypothetical protein
MGTHKMYCPAVAEPTYGRERKTRGEVRLVLKVGLRGAVPRAAQRFVCETHCRDQGQMQATVDLKVVAPTGVEGKKMQAGLAGAPSL